MLDHERRHWTLRWEVQAPRLTLEEAMHGVQGFRLNPDRDRELFDLLLEYDALATRHLLFPEFGLFVSRALADQRLAELWRAGFVARARVPAHPGFPGEAETPAESLRSGGEYAWALTPLGFEALLAWGSPAARALQGVWVPMADRPATRELGARAVAVADLALGLCAHLAQAAGGSAVWISGLQVGRRLDWAGSRGPRPAAAIWVLGRKGPALVAVEYATTGRPDSLRRRFDRYAEGLSHPDWWLAFPPHRHRYALWSFPRRGSPPSMPDPFALAQAILGERPELARQVLLVCEDDWRAGRWLATGAPDCASPQDLASALLGIATGPGGRRVRGWHVVPPAQAGGSNPC